MQMLLIGSTSAQWDMSILTFISLPTKAKLLKRQSQKSTPPIRQQQFSGSKTDSVHDGVTALSRR